jgi:hypothetical protein
LRPNFGWAAGGMQPHPNPQQIDLTVNRVSPYALAKL